MFVGVDIKHSLNFILIIPGIWVFLLIIISFKALFYYYYSETTGCIDNAES